MASPSDTAPPAQPPPPADVIDVFWDAGMLDHDAGSGVFDTCFDPGFLDVLEKHPENSDRVRNMVSILQRGPIAPYISWKPGRPAHTSELLSFHTRGSIQLDMASEVPIVTESAGSSPPPKVAKKPEQKSSEQAPVGSKFQLCTETPALPPFIGPAFDQAATNDLSAGNHSYIRELKEHGHLGLFLKRSAATPEPEFFELRPSDFFEAIQGTLQTVLLRLLKLKSELSDTEIVDRADSMSIVLATGCCVTAFLKLRAIILNYPERYNSAILKGPRISSALPVPTAYAVAIQQFGEVNIADMPTRKKAIPCFPQTGHTYGIPNPHRWSSNAYSQAVEYARSLGMRFSIVDLKVKKGSAWWLLRQHFVEDVFELQCSVPEVNFTEEMAVTHTLFLKDDEINPSNPFINITSLGADNYGTFLSNPHQGINVSSFEALSDAAAEVWQNV